SGVDLLADKLLLRGVRVELTDSLRKHIAGKAARLLGQRPSISRLEIEIEGDPQPGELARYIAKGHMEADGRTVLGSVVGGEAELAAELLIDKLERMLRGGQSGLRRPRAPKARPTFSLPAAG